MVLCGRTSDARRTLGQKNVWRCFAEQLPDKNAGQGIGSSPGAIRLAAISNYVCREPIHRARIESRLVFMKAQYQGTRFSLQAMRHAACSVFKLRALQTPCGFEIWMAQNRAMTQNWTIQKCPRFSGHLIQMNEMRDFPGLPDPSDRRGRLPQIEGVVASCNAGS